MKKCFKCGIEKELSEYYVHPQMGDGHLNKCKDCTKKDSKSRINILCLDATWIESEKRRGREKYHRLYAGTGKVNKKRNERWKNKFPEKKKATSHSQHMKKPFDGAEKHHWSYNAEHYKDVIWLTKKQHMKGHRFIIYDQERMMYRRTDNNELLDSKESHEKWIRWCIENKED